MLSMTEITEIIDHFLSIDNFYQAWSKVAANQGSCGIDNETIDDFQKNLSYNLTQLIDSINNNNYQALPCKQVFIPKNKNSFRELRIPTVRDRIIQQALLNVISPLIDPHFSEASFAYRPNISYIQAVEKIAFWRDIGYQFVLDGDLVKFFDNLDHQRLLMEVRKFINHPGILYLIKSWITAGILTENGHILATKGVSQGAVISPILANIYLHEFDQIISHSDLKLVRYADDFVILAKTQERIIAAYPQVVKILEDMKLELHPQKTQITNFQRGFRFLGHGFLENAIFPLDDGFSQSKNQGKKKHFQKRKKKR
jgi:RNA-directed DNA polymerase